MSSDGEPLTLGAVDSLARATQRLLDRTVVWVKFRWTVFLFLTAGYSYKFLGKTDRYSLVCSAEKEGMGTSGKGDQGMGRREVDGERQVEKRGGRRKCASDQPFIGRHM